MTLSGRAYWLRSRAVPVLAALVAIGCAELEPLDEGEEPVDDDERTSDGDARALGGGRARDERVLYVAAVSSGDTVNPDMMTAVDADPSSSTYGQIIARVDMPQAGDNLHHFGYSLDGQRLIVPGLASSRMHVIDVRRPRSPRLASARSDLVADSGYVSPHTVVPLEGGVNLASMLGADTLTGGPAGLVLLDDRTGAFVRHYGPGPMRAPGEGADFMYDIAVSHDSNRMVTTAWGWPKYVFQSPYQPGGDSITIWNLHEETVHQKLRLVPDAQPLEADWLNAPGTTVGFTITASAGVWMWEDEDHDDVYAIHNVILPTDFTVLACDMAVSSDDRWLFVSNYPDGVRQYDITNPAAPVFIQQVPVPHPCMMRLSVDETRLYVTNSVFRALDDDPVLGGNDAYGIYLFDLDPDGGMISVTEDGGPWVDYMNIQKKFGRGPAGPHMIAFDPGTGVAVGSH